MPNLQFPTGPLMAPTVPAAVPSNQSVVIPQITIPQPLQLPQIQQTIQAQTQGPQLIPVKGMDGAKQYPTVANARYVLFDDNDDVMYIKETDQNNYPVSLKRYRFFEEAEPVPAPPPEYVTMEEFNKFKEELLNAKQSVRAESKPYNNKPYAKQTNSGNGNAAGESSS